MVKGKEGFEGDAVLVVVGVTEGRDLDLHAALKQLRA